MKNIIYLLPLFLFNSIIAQGNKEVVNISQLINYTTKPTLSKSDIQKLDSMDVKVMSAGSCYSCSSPKYQRPNNGEGGSNNVSKNNMGKFQKDLLGIFVSENDLIPMNYGYIANTLYFINTTDSNFDIMAEDSRLPIMAQVKDESGNWVNIEYLPRSWCGNSYHALTLGSNEYWKFPRMIYKGDYKTKLRYVLETKDKIFISNEIDTYINPSQMTEKKEITSSDNLMNPYN